MFPASDRWLEEDARHRPSPVIIAIITPYPGDVREAEEVCRALGPGPLIDRVPAGTLQPVGETVWRLSHGERDRVFEILVIDESFAALDPHALRRRLEVVLARPEAIIVIAHP